MKIANLLPFVGLVPKVLCVAGQHLGPVEFMGLGPSRKPKRHGMTVEFYKCSDCGRVFEKKP